MAILITGLQGSGKSYKAMYDMYYGQNKYYKIHTNMDGLRETDKIIILNFKTFTDDVLTQCYNIIVNQSKEYKQVIEYLQTISLLPEDVSQNNRVLLVIDEAQNYFSKKSPILSWFITQHRHLYIELILITQKYTLLHSDYHLFNIAYNAFPPVKQFSKSSISYNEYAGLPMNSDNFVRKFSIKKEENVFDMYVSGDKVDSPNVIKRYIFMIIFLVAIVLVGVFYFTNLYGSHTPQNKPDIPQQNKQVQKSHDKPEIETNADYKLYVFVVFEDKFHILNLDNSDNLPLSILKYVREVYFKKVIEVVEHDKYHTSLYVIADSALENFLNYNTKESDAGSGISLDAFKAQ